MSAEPAGYQQALEPPVGKGNPMANVVRNRNFQLLWLGQGTSLLGDQFSMIAVPWLVLLITGDPLALGIALALEGVPRAIFMLVGGAVTDRYSARTVMLASDVVRLAMTAALAAFVFTGGVNIWVIYAFTLIFGTVAGFFLPASSAMIPKIVDRDDLQAGNALFQGTGQLSVFVGPIVAGGIIAYFAGAAVGSTGIGTFGIAVALTVDAATFLVSVATLLLMKFPKAAAAQAAGTVGDVLQSIKDGIGYLWANRALRDMFLVITALNFLFAGPLIVGIAVIANQRLAEGAMAFGIILAAYGGGNLGGIIAVGVLPKPKPQRLGLIMLGVIPLFGIGEILLGFTTSLAMGFTIMLVLGLFNGYISILAVTLLQKIVSPDMMGRLMSLLLLSNVGLAPVSQALAGALVKVSIEGLFAGAGILILVTAALAALSPSVRKIGQLAEQVA